MEKTNTAATPKAKPQASAQETKPAAPAESVYTAEELAGAARQRLGVLPEVVQAALKLAGKDKATFEETKRLVKAFMERRVN